MLSKERRVGCIFMSTFQPHRLPQGNELHLRRNNALTRIMHLAHVLAIAGTSRPGRRRKTDVEGQEVVVPPAGIFGTWPNEKLGIISLLNPTAAAGRQSSLHL